MRTLSYSTSAKLFATGATLGPIVDSLHNQCLLRYDVLPIALEWPEAFHRQQNTVAGIATVGDVFGSITEQYPYFFCSSWTVPPLLGFAYVILGGLLPRIVESFSESFSMKQSNQESPSYEKITKPIPAPSSAEQLRMRAILAVSSTALIIKLSEFLETHPHVFDNLTLAQGQLDGTTLSVLVMIAAAITQWVLLDGSITALLVAGVTAIGGPLSELPFVGHGVWTYLEGAGDYFPLQNVLPNAATTIGSDGNNLLIQLLPFVFGTANYRDLALSSITGPCYFAVTMDAIALGRWFDSSPLPSSPTSSLDNATR